MALFEALGFDTVHSFDYSDYEGATSLLDLNSGVVPDSAVGQYDVVFDSGTIEHVFYVPNSLKAIVDTTKNMTPRSPSHSWLISLLTSRSRAISFSTLSREAEARGLRQLSLHETSSALSSTQHTSSSPADVAKS